MPGLIVVLIVAYVLVEAGREVRDEAAARIAPGWARVREAVDRRMGAVAHHPVGRYAAILGRLGLGLLRGIGSALVFGAAIAGAAGRGGKRGYRQAQRRVTQPPEPGLDPPIIEYDVVPVPVPTQPEPPSPPEPEPFRPRQPTQPSPNGDTTMTETPEVNYEATLVTLDLLDQDMTQLDTAIEQLEAIRTQVRERAQLLAEQLAAVKIDAATAAGLADVVDALSPEHIDPLVQAHEAGTTALAATRQNVITTYADAADTVATTGVDAPYLAPAA